MLWFAFCLLVSYFYLIQNDPRFPVEQPSVIWTGLLLSLGVVCLWYLIKPQWTTNYLNLQRWVRIVILAWIIGACISATVFVMAWFPDPHHIADYSLWQRFIDGIFESISWFTTAGWSILPSVEIFPRSILMRRSMTHFIGGMGIVYMTITVLRSLGINRSEVINAESEGPHIVHYHDEKEAIGSGFAFLKVYILLTVVLIVCLFISGWYARLVPYEMRYDNLFDSINYAFSTMATGGFGVYDTSAGLWVRESWVYIIKWLKNPLSEWIIGFFMVFAGMNFWLWYELFFLKNWKIVIRNRELQAFLILVISLTLGIVYFRLRSDISISVWDAARRAFFSVTSIVSTTGLANYDFALWPTNAIGLLLVVYFTWSCVWSTAGWIKILRLLIFLKFAILQIRNLVNNKPLRKVKIDWVEYSVEASSIVLLNIILYFLLFVLGWILIMEVNPIISLLDGSQIANNFTTAFGASIANLGNIWPIPSIDWVNLWPSGNYAVLNSAAKLILSLLMLLWRVGVLSLLLLFMNYKAQQKIWHKIETVEYDETNSNEVIHLRT